ncbi:MAG TPA: hypothetical protein VLF15_11190, partial [Pseudoxanthomonas sp.]|nr:hypothetical protein [Pseudoxanthomonas sp.]
AQHRATAELLGFGMRVFGRTARNHGVVKLEGVMDVGVNAKATVAVPGKAHAAGQAGGLAKACNAAWRCDSGLPEEPAPYLIRGLPASAAAAALSGLPWTPAKDGAGRLAAAALVGNASHPNVHNTL